MEEIVISLKQCLDDGNMPDKGNKPIRACGTRFIDHKVAAMNRFIDHFGAYVSHLCNLTEGNGVTQGYILKWQKASGMCIVCRFVKTSGHC